MTGRPRYQPIYLSNSLRVTTVWVWHKHRSRVHVPDNNGQKLLKEGPMRSNISLRESSTESIAKESIVEMRDITPESIITVTAFRDETMDMRDSI